LLLTWVNHQELAEAKEIIRQIHCREVYKCVGEFIVPQSKSEHFPKRVEAKDIITYQPADEYSLLETDIIVHNFKMNYAMADKNPVDHVHFFTKAEPETKFIIPREQVSALIPEIFSEQYVRVYCRKKEKARQAHLAFQSYLSQYGCTMPSRHSSPYRMVKRMPANPNRGSYRKKNCFEF